MDIISMINTDRLYWLGRYSERVYTTIRLFGQSFDTLIDRDQSAVEDFCRKLEIPCIYQSGEDFVERYCFDPTDVNSIYANLTRAYDNAVELREEIGSEAVSYIQLALYVMNNARGNQSPMILFQKVIDDILAFWGICDDGIDSENVRNIIKTGKRIERLDLYARLHRSQKDMLREVHRLTVRIDRTHLKYKKNHMDELKTLVESPVIDYDRVVYLVENLLEE